MSATFQLADQQMSLQPLCRKSTEVLVGVFGAVQEDKALVGLLQAVALRLGNVSTSCSPRMTTSRCRGANEYCNPPLLPQVVLREVRVQDVAECDLVVAGISDVVQAVSLLAPQALLLAQLPSHPIRPSISGTQVLLQQAFENQRLGVFKKVGRVLGVPPPPLLLRLAY